MSPPQFGANANVARRCGLGSLAEERSGTSSATHERGILSDHQHQSEPLEEGAERVRPWLLHLRGRQDLVGIARR
jgi:hypothetical protein